MALSAKVGSSIRKSQHPLAIKSHFVKKKIVKEQSNLGPLFALDPNRLNHCVRNRYLTEWALEQSIQSEQENEGYPTVRL